MQELHNGGRSWNWQYYRYVQYDHFRSRRRVPIIGVIVNKTLEDKLEKIKHYIGTWLEIEQYPYLA
ncbi:MAG: hypothetical protein R2771_14955 [Saprospiraceae bacterium]